MTHFSLHFFMLCATTIITFTTQGVKASFRSKGNANVTMQFEAIYQFGDSLSDTGNLIREPYGARTAFARLPYGRTFFHRPTGRCSDGLLMVDYFAMYFHLPLLNPYLARRSDFSNGANFAVAGATALDPAALAARNVSLPLTRSTLARQIRWFKYLLHSTLSNPREIKEKLQKSLVMMGEIGGNDYNFAFFQGRTMHEVYKLVPYVVQAIKAAVQEVIKLGATNIVVPGNFPIGCVPLYLVGFPSKYASKYDEFQCLKDYNDFSKFHNELLIKTIQELQQEHPGVAIAYGDYYSALMWVITHAPRLGFEVDGSKRACCALGNNPYNYDPRRGCGSPGVPVCQDPSKTVNWDGIHMTQEGNKNVARWLLRNIVPTLQRHIHV
ncbi:acetylajmalan esterase [Beta vulgaris subsp. vulgaris]|uniref:acetylajmalan esterase n=1 Tax=Beta vulgaris subsp. vulgaris TaxID=3555 RepID=UPI00203673E4|nr:acetylajmalan esterase [Beta vulgaris subsp. vulgaris]